MKAHCSFVAILALASLAGPASAGVVTDRFDLDRVNRKLQGQVVDHTHNHGADRRIWSAALCQKRDLYVYLPPCFDPSRKYPLVLWFHQGREDEGDFLKDMATTFDQAIACGLLPPLIVAAPDGSVHGRPPTFTSGSFFLNSKAGRFEDAIIEDVYEFVLDHYPIRPERAAHVLMGASMGGFAAFNLGIKHRDVFGIAVGFYPPVNLRWVDCHGHYLRNFDPCCWGWRTKFPPCEIVGRLGPLPIMIKHFTLPLYGLRRNLAEPVSRDNPIEMLEAHDVQPGQLDMFIAYGGRDELNVDAQVESFLHMARARGLEVGVAFDPKANHTIRTVWKLFPQMAEWLAPRIK